MTNPTAQLYERRQYKSPPIQEAICEVRFAPTDGDPDPLLPGVVHERLNGEYSGSPRMQQQTVLDVTGAGAGPQAQIVPVVQLTTEDGRGLVSLAPHSLGIHALAPYPGWEDFYSRIGRAIDAYGASTAERKVVRLGLRYINQIVVPSSGVSLHEYFVEPPRTPVDFPEGLFGIFARFESRYLDLAPADVRLLYTFATVETPPAEAGFVLDFDVFQSWEDVPVSLAEAATNLATLKELETAAFEAVITDQTRGLIDGD